MNSPCSIWAAAQALGFGALSTGPEKWVSPESPRVALTSRRRRFDVLSQDLASRAGVTLRFEVGDIREPMPEPDGSVDICLCLYGVLNHLPADDLSTVFAEVARITKGKFVATVRAIGSTPTIYVDGVKAAKSYHQDNAHGRLEVEFQNGTQTSFPSHLFSAAEIRALANCARDRRIERPGPIPQPLRDRPGLESRGGDARRQLYSCLARVGAPLPPQSDIPRSRHASSADCTSENELRPC